MIVENPRPPAEQSNADARSALKLHLLSTVDIFRDLNEADMKGLTGLVDMVTCHKGQILYRPEEKVEVLFLLKKGKIQVYYLSSEGKKLIFDTIGPGTFFGEMPLTGQSMRQGFAEATEDALVCVLSRTDMERLLLQKPMVALRIVESLGRRLEESQAKLEVATLRNATARVVRTILRLVHSGEELSGITHQEIADMTGLYRETVTNILNQLQAQGLLELGKKKLVVRDKKGLEEVAGA